MVQTRKSPLPWMNVDSDTRGPDQREFSNFPYCEAVGDFKYSTCRNCLRCHLGAAPICRHELPKMILIYAALGLLSYVLLFHALDVLSRRLTRRPPGPPGLPLLGSLLQIGPEPHKSLQRLSQKYGPLMCLSVGLKPTVVVSSAAMAEAVLKTHDRDLSGRDPVQAACVFGDHRRSIVSLQPGTRWRLLRRISATHLFSQAKLHSLRHLRRSHLRARIHDVLQKSADSASTSACVNVRDIVSDASLAVLGGMIFGEDMFQPKSQRFRDFKVALWRFVESVLQPNLLDFFPAMVQRLAMRMNVQSIVRDTKRNNLRVYAFLDELFRHRLLQRRGPNGEDEDRPKDVLDSLLDVTQDSGCDFDLYDIKVYIVDILTAGIDTTIITIEWAMAELIRHPSMMERVQSEMDQVVGRSRLVEEADTENLPYLRAVVKETLRLHPAAPLLLPHRAQRSCRIGEFVVPEDAQVIVNFWAIARDPAVWKQPNQFSPDRFLDKSGLDFRGQDFEFIPFGAGRRICVGMPLANVTIHTVLAALCQAFWWRPPLGMQSPLDLEMDDKFGLTMHKATPLLALATPRLPFHVYECL